MVAAPIARAPPLAVLPACWGWWRWLGVALQTLEEWPCHSEPSERLGKTGCSLGQTKAADSELFHIRLAVCGDFLRPRPSPLEAAAESGLEAGERVAGWLREQDGGVA